MQHTEYELEHFPRLCAFSNAIPLLSLEEIINTIENDADFIEEINQVFWRNADMPQDERALKDALKKKITEKIGNYCAQSPGLFRYIMMGNSQSRAIYPLSNMLSSAKSLILARIFRLYGTLDASEQAIWRRRYWPNERYNSNGWENRLLRKDYSSQKGQERKRDRNIQILCEVEGTAALVIDYICSTYHARPGGFMGSAHSENCRFSKRKGIKLQTLVAVAKQWPKLAYKLINAMYKGPENLGCFQELSPLLLEQVKENHAGSILTLMNIKFFEALMVEGSDFKEVFELCNQYKVYGDSYIHYKQLQYFADLLLGHELPNHFFDFCLRGILKEKLFLRRVELAFEIYNKILQGTNDRDLAAEVRVQLDDPNFRFQLAEYYHRIGQFEKAQEFYDGILNDGQRRVDSTHISILKTPLRAEQRTQKLADLNEAERSVLASGREALQRQAILWADRLENLSRNASNDPVLLFQMAERLICKKKYAEAFRLLSAIPQSSKHYEDAQAKLFLLSPHQRDFDPKEPLLQRIDIVEFVLPHFRRARDAGHEEAEKMVPQLEAEFENLRQNKSGGYNASFVKEIGKLVVNDPTGLKQESGFGHC